MIMLCSVVVLLSALYCVLLLLLIVKGGLRKKLDVNPPRKCSLFILRRSTISFSGNRKTSLCEITGLCLEPFLFSYINPQKKRTSKMLTICITIFINRICSLFWVLRHTRVQDSNYPQFSIWFLFRSMWNVYSFSNFHQFRLVRKVLSAPFHFRTIRFNPTKITREN